MIIFSGTQWKGKPVESDPSTQDSASATERCGEDDLILESPKVADDDQGRFAMM